MVPRGHRNWIEVEHIGHVIVAKFTTPSIVDEEKILVIGRELLNLVQQSGRRPLVLNFQGVERASAELLNNIVALGKRARARGGQIVFCDLNPEIAEVLKVMNPEDPVTICEHEKEALSAV
jgi:anti-anti-sigma regulatory factor